MASLLNNSKLALWVWIVIIVITSLVVIGTIAFVIRFTVNRRRQASFIDTFGDENLPQRRVTVRRGRVVPSSRYLSLTGSKFGLNAFGPDEADTQSRAGARSKSPFEWWNTLKDRSQSRNSQVTQITNETSSVWGMPTSPNQQRMYQHRDLAFSSASLASTTKDDDVSTTVSEVRPTSPPAAQQPPNFSRSFSNRAHRSGFSPRQHTLSRIEESSPHASMISARQSRGASYASNSRDTKTSTPSSLPPSPSPLRAQFPSPLRNEHQDQTSSKPNSVYHESREAPSKSLEVPRTNMAYNGSRSSFGDPEPRRISQVSSQNSFDVHSTKSSRRQSGITALPVSPNPEQMSEYWGTRSDLRPVRSNSGKKGKVLRKKSLRRSEMVTQVDS
ncbi:hypothetical protein H2198_007728 [Neophaeococcomyces mojaviensis]|uniref:Uncharacterized protein n=1 Tax=Neophaeococcomyces mojaviensis TaxID=3383035 RepID=A0ACC2ZZB8_9EURO|nr:hypothetical protein H2198_007728 [Knufia sp. JES_112]